MLHPCLYWLPYHSYQRILFPKKKSFKPNKIDFPFSLEKCLIQEKEVSEGGKMDLLTGTFFLGSILAPWRPKCNCSIEWNVSVCVC